jgi:hypothetical protein
MLPYLVDARHRAAAGEAGRRHALGYSWERTAAGTLDVYREVLGAQLVSLADADLRGA